MSEELKMISKKRCKFWMEPSSYRKPICHWMIIALISLVVVGCPAPTLKEDPKIEALTSGLDMIDAIKLADLSDSPPVSVKRTLGA